MKFTNPGDVPQEVIAAKEVMQEMHEEKPHGTPAQGSVQKWKVSTEMQTTPNIFATRHFTPIYDKPYPKSHYLIAMAEVRKQEKDFTKEVDELLPETSTLAKVCRVAYRVCYQFNPLFTLVRSTFRCLGEIARIGEADTKCMRCFL